MINIEDCGVITEKILSLAGLCRKAGGIITGTDAVLEAVRSKKTKPSVVIVSSDASDRTAKQLFDKAAFYGVTAVRLNADSQKISSSLGKKSPCAAAAVINKGPYLQIKKLAEQIALCDGADEK